IARSSSKIRGESSRTSTTKYKPEAPKGSRLSSRRTDNPWRAGTFSSDKRDAKWNSRRNPMCVASRKKAQACPLVADLLIAPQEISPKSQNGLGPIHKSAPLVAMPAKWSEILAIVSDRAKFVQ